MLARYRALRIWHWPLESKFYYCFTSGFFIVKCLCRMEIDEYEEGSDLEAMAEGDNLSEAGTLSEDITMDVMWLQWFFSDQPVVLIFIF